MNHTWSGLKCMQIKYLNTKIKPAKVEVCGDDDYLLHHDG